VPAAEIDRTDLARSIQYQLRRVGCDPGTIDGQWGRKARSAMEAFNRHAKVRLQVDEPSAEARDAIADRKSRICPLDCDDDEVEKDGKCVPDTLARTKKPSAAKRDTSSSRETTREAAPRKPQPRPSAEGKKSGSGGLCWSPTGRDGLRPCSELGAAGSRAY
jgi:hypothetical protein